MKSIKVISILLIFFVLLNLTSLEAKSYLNEILKIEKWLSSTEKKTEFGLVWPVDPQKPDAIAFNLYSGTPGVILFYLELYYATNNTNYLKKAVAGGNHLLSIYQEVKDSSFYSGISGIGFVFCELFKAAKDHRFEKAFYTVLQLLDKRAIRTGKGIEWNNVTDIIGGSAGIGLFLIYAEEYSNKSLIKITEGIADRLIELAIKEKKGIKWKMAADYPKLMPNFAHGTAGIGFFLSKLYFITKKNRYIKFAQSSADYLLSVSEKENCFIFHHEPDGEDLFYLGWCHGPVGTSNLFYELFKYSGADQWMNWVKQTADGIIKTGIPEKLTEGFWNNNGRCCGTSGIAEFFLDFYLKSKNKRYLKFSINATNVLISKGIKDKKGLRWVDSEHRTRPELLKAQTGLMQGVSGMGLWLLKIHSFMNNSKNGIVFPDKHY